MCLPSEGEERRAKRKEQRGKSREHETAVGGQWSVVEFGVVGATGGSPSLLFFPLTHRLVVHHVDLHGFIGCDELCLVLVTAIVGGL